MTLFGSLRSFGTGVEKEMADVSFNGYLVIYVDGYKTVDTSLQHIVHHGTETFSVPDREMPPIEYEVGSEDWWRDGWAVGENTRGRLCKRLGYKPLRRFHEYDEAIAYIFDRQRKFKNQGHILVYVSKTNDGKERRDIVHSLDDVLAVDLRFANERDPARMKRLAAEHPDLEKLRTAYGNSMAFRLSNFAKEIRENGKDAVKACMNRDTYYRYLSQLKKAGIALSTDDQVSGQRISDS